MDSVRTGIEHLDDDHRKLISHINSIAELERSAETTAVIDALSGFKADLAKHFQGEETYLIAVDYPKLGHHTRHHEEILNALDQLMRDIQEGKPIEGTASDICYHELIGVVLRRDMEFINWLADRPELKK
ncbi:hemerythrin family protein [uncultured Sneathiella sp.]|uniref:bacteriohemerythrin n=1 Tax=uncultured Sneathiella sp. TaxID=879315 RepID=UPI0030D99B7C|tara:strand:- start:652 stop:1041 length:390 start_codon:yes stop_codon:yes gene_type:complete